jgi:hypothetical protein
MNAIRSESFTFFVDDLFVFGIVSSEEGDCLLHIKSIFKTLVDLPLVITGLSQDKRGRVRRETAVVHGVESTRATCCCCVKK